MKHICTFIFCFVFFNTIFADIFDEKTNISAEKIEYHQNLNEVIFFKNVQIESNIFSIKANKATYNNNKDLFLMDDYASSISI